MAITTAILSDMVVRNLYDATALWNKMNRNFDGLVKDKFAKSIDIPRNPKLIVSKDPVAVDSANRKQALADSDTVNASFEIYTVPITQEEEERILADSKLLNNFLLDTNDALSDGLDADVLAEACASGTLLTWNDAVLSWKNISAINAKFTAMRVPKRDRIIVIPSTRQEEFEDIDLVKQAMAFNRELLEKGVFVINNIRFYISPDVPLTGDEDSLVGIYAPGLAVVLKGYMDRKEAYSNAVRKTYIDYNSGAAIKLLRQQYAVKYLHTVAVG